MIRRKCVYALAWMKKAELTMFGKVAWCFLNTVKMLRIDI